MAYPDYPSNVVFALVPGIPAPGLVAAILTTSTVKAYAVPPDTEYINVAVAGTGTISSGVITIEEAATPDYAGTWSAISTVSGTTVTGGAVAVSRITGYVRAIRARVSTAIAGGGSVSVDFTAGLNN
jgi:hypothetical protein